MLTKGARTKTPRSAIYFALSVLLIGGVFAARIALVGRFTTDDSGITYAYALHLLQGQGFRAVLGGATVEGYSNFLWLLLLVGVGKLGASISVAAKVFGGLFGALGIGLSITLLRRLEDRNGALTLSDLTLGLLLASDAQYSIWSIGGLENPLFACLLLALVLRCIHELESPKSWPFSSLLAIGLCLTRPEGALYVAVLLSLWLIVAWRAKIGRRQVVVAGGLFTILFLLYHLWHYAAFLDLRPNTFYAKRPALDLQHLSEGWTYFLSSCKTGLFGFGGPLALCALFRAVTRKLFVVAAILPGVFFIFYAGGDWMGYFRLGSHLIPLYAVLVVAGAPILAQLSFFRRASEKTTRNWRLLLLYAVELGLLAVYVYRQETNARFRADIDRRTGSHYERVLAGAAAMYEKASQFDIFPATVLTHDFGGFAWRSKRDFQPIDYLGLCDLSIARILYLWERRPDRARRGLLQSLFRERGPAPSLIYLPHGSFFSNLEASVDEELAYFHLSLPSKFALLVHRGSLVHFYPPFEKFSFQALLDGSSQRLRLLGFSPHGVLSPGQRLTLRVAILPLPLLVEVSTVTIKLALRSGENRIETVEKKLFGGEQVMLREWQPGEPLYFELPLTLPAAPAASYSFEIGLRYNKGPWRWQALSTVAAGSDFSAPEAPLPRFPNGLPGASSPRLAALEVQLRALWERRRLERDLTLADRPLAQALLQEGMACDAKAQGADAYLAYVWAMQADPDASAALVRRVHVLRGGQTDGEREFKAELGLLRRYYASGSDEDASRLADYLAKRRRPAESQYFLSKLPKRAP